ncbi:MAG TPA: hypothetical protein VGM39_08790 [Kofleriaceae bacterium]|jgi:uncharacterized membrane protein YfcA
MMGFFFGAAVAGHKNRNMLAWAFAGLLVPPVLFVLGFLPTKIQTEPPPRPLVRILPDNAH